MGHRESRGWAILLTMPLVFPKKTIRLALVLLAGVAGCTPGLPAVELGTGHGGFVPLEDGESVRIVRGFQGAQHIWAQVRLLERVDGRVEIGFRIEEVDTAEEVHRNRFEVELLELRDTEEGLGETFGRPGTYAFVPDPERIDGREVRLVGWIESADGERSSDSRRVIPMDETER